MRLRDSSSPDLLDVFPETVHLAQRREDPQADLLVGLLRVTGLESIDLLGDLLDGPLVVLEVVVATDDVAAGDGTAQRRLDGADLALLDGAGQADLTLPIEQVLLGHLPEIDVDRIDVVRAIGVVLLAVVTGIVRVVVEILEPVLLFPEVVQVDPLDPVVIQFDSSHLIPCVWYAAREARPVDSRCDEDSNGHLAYNPGAMRV